MGQNQSSSSLPGRRKSFRRSFRSPFPRRSRTTQSLSATFNYLDPDVKGEQLNINTATAEELMTLPGVTRAIAQNIIEHRLAIGRYHKVEDLALVTGVGAEKLSVMKPEVCVHRRRNNSNQSSLAQSLDSLDSCGPGAGAVDLNSASVFSLMSLRGVTQELAASIVDHRERRGPFNNVEELIKVRGMTASLVGMLRNQVLLGPPLHDTPLPVSRKLSNALSNGHVVSRLSDRKVHTNGFLPVKDIFELLCAYSQRPFVDEQFHYKRDGRAALRLASWNLTTMTADKAENPGVREVICRTILENRLSLVATQEVMDPAASAKLVSEMNEPRLRKVAEWRGRRGKWRSHTTLSADHKRGCGFLYDADTGLSLGQIDVLQDNDAALSLLALFQVEGVEVSVMNVNLVSGCKSTLESCRTQILQSEPDIVIGDFSPFPEAEFVEEGYTRVLPPPTVTNSLAPGNSGANYMDNIYLSKRFLSRYTGVSGVVRQGLTHVAIPRGWVWGGPASEHCPVWCELFT